MVVQLPYSVTSVISRRQNSLKFSCYVIIIVSVVRHVIQGSCTLTSKHRKLVVEGSRRTHLPVVKGLGETSETDQPM